MMNKDELKGKATQVKGVIKEETGKLIDDPELEEDGEIDQAVGKVQEKAGTVRRKIEDAVKGV
jgi:uncharacterized protein YjbJ (UPF0337 family)